MRKYKPQHCSKSLAHKLVELELVAFSPADHHLLWFGMVLSLSVAQCACFQVLWDNFLRGNLPVPGGRILNGYPRGSTSHLSHLFKRSDAWTEKVIVGDGRGNFWLRLPDDLEERIAKAEAKLRIPSGGSWQEGEPA